MTYTYLYEHGEIAPDNALTGKEFIDEYLPQYRAYILCMAVNNHLVSLESTIQKDAVSVIFYDLSDPQGARCLATSSSALMLMAAEELFPDSRISIEHSYSQGFYCEPLSPENVPAGYVEQLRAKMIDHILINTPFIEKRVPIKEVKDIQLRRFHVVADSPRHCIRIYDLNGFSHWFTAPLVPAAGFVRDFSLTPYGKGFVLLYPTVNHPDGVPEFKESPKLFDVIRESETRGNILKIRNVYDINSRAHNSHSAEVIQLYEALHEKKIAEIADCISCQKNTRFVFIAGPSSSGKTTFMKRLSIQLRINGLTPKHISLDDYFVERENTPLDENGEKDYEHFSSLDHELLNTQLKALMQGEKVKSPTFNFEKGQKEYISDPLCLNDDEILILEGIHGLNPALADQIPEENKYRIYISALTQLNFNLYNRVSTADTRLLRRMYRDMQFRGHSPEQTILRWPSVRRGEAKWIFPYQENADIYFNSALEYEWSVFAGILLDTLHAISADSEAKVEAERLSRLLELFVPLATDIIPSTSLIQEFLGGSSFK